MKLTKIIIPLIAAISIAGFFIYNKKSIKNTVSINMSEEGFGVNEITVRPGTAITFVNTGSSGHWPASNIHPTHEIYPEFDPTKEIPPGGKWQFVFKKEGIWRFHDHSFPEFNGVIKVER